MTPGQPENQRSGSVSTQPASLPALRPFPGAQTFTPECRISSDGPVVLSVTKDKSAALILTPSPRGQGAGRRAVEKTKTLKHIINPR